MTDKPLTREEVLAVMDNCIEELSGYRPITDHPRLKGMSQARAAVEAVYAELDAAMKDADSVARLIGGQYMYHKQRFGAGDKITQAFSRLIDAIAKDRSHEA